MVGYVQVWNGLKVSNGYSKAMGMYAKQKLCIDFYNRRGDYKKKIGYIQWYA